MRLLNKFVWKLSFVKCIYLENVSWQFVSLNSYTSLHMYFSKQKPAKIMNSNTSAFNAEG